MSHRLLGDELSLSKTRFFAFLKLIARIGVFTFELMRYSRFTSVDAKVYLTTK